MSGGEKIKVMVVDDSVLIRKYASQILGELDNVEVVATAPDGRIAYQKILLYKPDLVVLDIEMPEMNGLELLKYVASHISEAQRPYFIMFSSEVGEGTDETFQALENGAEDFVKKPEGNIAENIENLRREFDIKIRELYASREEKTHDAERAERAQADRKAEYRRELPSEVLYGRDNLDKVLARKTCRPEILAVGSSTGGPIALRKILETLGPLPVPMVIAQHMPAGFTVEFAKNLSGIYRREVVEPADGDILRNGVIYVCPGGSHARIDRKRDGLAFRVDPKAYEGFFFKPSVDIFFRSVHDAAGGNALALVLSGMGRDGAIESVSIRHAGGLVMAQDRESSVVWGMPKSTIDNRGADIVIDLSDLGGAVSYALAKMLA